MGSATLLNKIILFIGLLWVSSAQAQFLGFTPIAPSQTISVTNSSSRVTLVSGGTTVKIQNVGTTEAFIAFGSATIVATTSNDSVPAGSCAVYNVAPSQSVAAITASSTTTLRVSQGNGGPVICSNSNAGAATGTVTSVSVISANGFAGTVANPTTTPAITLSTTITGLLSGNGTAISGTVPGTGVLTALGINTNTAGGIATYPVSGAGVTLTANSTLTSGFAAGNVLMSDGTTLQVGTNLNATSFVLNGGQALSGTIKLSIEGQGLASGATTTASGWYAQLDGDTTPRVRVGLNASDTASVAFGPGNATRDLFLERAGAAMLRFGTADAAAPVAQTFTFQNVLAGTTNTAGVNTTLMASAGTGTGLGGSFVFQVAAAGTTGSTQNPFATALTIDSTKLATFPGTIIIGAGAAITSSGPGGTLGSNAFNSTAYLPLTGGTISGALTLSSALTYGGVTLANSVTGTGSMVLSIAPTFTGTTTVSSLTASSNITVGGAQQFRWSGSTIQTAPANGQENITNSAATAGIGFDVSTDGTLKIRTRAQTGDGSLIAGTLQTISAASLTLTTGAIGMGKMTASASAPGAAGGKLELVCGTNSGTAKLIMAAGTSGTAVTIIDNVGAGVTGC